MPVAAMIVSFDQDKREANFAKHGLDLADGGIVLRGPLLERLDLRTDYGEDRWLGTGLLGTRIVLIVFVEYGAGEFRIISLRSADNYERAEFEAFRITGR